jgi:hypothetical protein
MTTPTTPLPNAVASPASVGVGNTPILNQAWEDVASDVTGAIEKAVQPLLKRAVDEVYTGLLETTQDYLSDNLAFNISSRISAAEREAADDRRRVAELIEAMETIRDLPGEINPANYSDDDVHVLNNAFIEAYQVAVAAISRARGEQL